MREGDLISLSLFLVGKAMSEESTPDVKSGLVPEQVSPSNPPEESTPELDKIKGRLYGEVEKGMNEPNWELGLSTGYYLLNLACSGRIDVGLAPDYYYVWAGRSGSGKTMVNLAALAEASINPAFKKHRLIYDGPESGALMSWERFYGPALAERVEPPAGTRKEPKHSKTLEGFYHNVWNALSKGPFVYVLDSMDALPTNDEWKDFLKKHGKRDEDGEIPLNEAGSYHTERARCNSHHLRLLFNQLQGSNSILIVIFQSRESLSFGFGNKDVKGGGLAPTFFAGLEIWSKVETHLKIKHTRSGNDIEQGVICEAQVKKGRITGKNRSVSIPIYHSFGIDNIGGMVDYLVEWGRWTKTGKDYNPQDGRVNAVDFGFKEMKRELLIQKIIENDFESELKLIVQETWNEIEDFAAISRPSRYHPKS